MSWASKFAAWKEAGTSTSLLLARVNALFNNGYINEAEWIEIVTLIEGWTIQFTNWKNEGKTVEWMIAYANMLKDGNSIDEALYNEIVAIINA